MKTIYLLIEWTDEQGRRVWLRRTYALSRDEATARCAEAKREGRRFEPLELSLHPLSIEPAERAPVFLVTESGFEPSLGLEVDIPIAFACDLATARRIRETRPPGFPDLSTYRELGFQVEPVEWRATLPEAVDQRIAAAPH